MRFTKLRWKNLFSFGDYYSEIALDQDGIVFVKGTNKDEHSSNGSGKSSIIDIFVWALYGKPLKSIPIDNILNVHTPNAQGHACVEFWHGSDYYEINRYRNDRQYGNGVVIKKNGIIDDTFTDGTNRDVQSRIDELLGLDYYALTSSIIFSSELPFQIPKLTAEKRRAYLEDILGLNAYSVYGKIAKSKARAVHKEADELLVEDKEVRNRLVAEEADLDMYSKRLENFDAEKVKAVQLLEDELEKTKTQIASIDLSKRKALESRIATIQECIAMLKERQGELKVEVAKWSTQLESIESNKKEAARVANKELAVAKSEYERNSKAIKNALKLLESECPTCKRGWNPTEVEQHTAKHTHELSVLQSSYQSMIETIRRDYESRIAELESNANTISEQQKWANDRYSQITDEISSLTQELKNLMNDLGKLPTQDTLNALLEKKQRLEADISKKQTETNPYQEVIDNLRIRIIDTTERLNRLQERKTDIDERLKLATFWDESFNNDGLKLFIFDTVIPLLNNRIAYYLPILFDGKDVAITFDKLMNMTVTVNGKVMAYGGLSQGERKRCDLAIAFALLDTAQAQHGIVSNVMWFDEIFDSSLDSKGVKIVSDLLRSMPVQTIFVMSHRLEIAHDFDIILEVEKRGQFSRLLS